MIPIDTIVVPQGAEYQAVCRGLKKARVNTVRVIPIPIGTKNVLQTLVNRSFLSITCDTFGSLLAVVLSITNPASPPTISNISFVARSIACACKLKSTPLSNL